MVIQRIQTLYLLLVAVLMGIFTFLPVIGINVDGNNLAIGAFETCCVTHPSWLLLTLDALIVVLSVIAIFKYKDLKGQLRLVSIVVLMVVLLLVCITVLFIGQRSQCTAVFQWSIALPCAALVFAILARKGIKHDRKLLSDSERIR